MAILTLASRMHAKYLAYQHILPVAVKYDEIWNQLLIGDSSEENARALKQLTERSDAVRARAQASLNDSIWGKLLVFLGLKRPRYVGLWNLKQRQNCDDIDELFRDAFSISLDFQMWVGSWNTAGRVVQGPAKSVDRAIQKVTRSYRRDPSCLTDLVRCTIVVESLSEAAECFDGILQRAFVGQVNFVEGWARGRRFNWDEEGDTAPLCPPSPNTATLDEPGQQPSPAEHLTVGKNRVERLTKRNGSSRKVSPMTLAPQSEAAKSTEPPSEAAMSTEPPHEAAKSTAPDPDGAEMLDHEVVPSHNTSSGDGEELSENRRVMRITAIKNRFDLKYTSKGNGGYRDMNLNVEVGYVTDSLGCQFVPVLEWPTTRGLRTHICELQIILSAMYEVKKGEGYTSYVQFRNMIVK